MKHYFPLPCPGRDVECDSECGSSGDTRHGGGGQAHHQDQPQHRQGSGPGSSWGSGIAGI